MKFLEALENPEGEIDLDAGGVENLAIKFFGQSFAYQQLVDFGAPARSRRRLPQTSAAFMTHFPPQ